MTWTLFKTNFRNNRFILILMTLVFCFYMSIIMTMYDPNSIDALNQMIEALPETLARAMNFDTLGDSLLKYISGYIYGFLVFLFPMILTIVVNHRLIASLVDQGSMAYLLSTPHSRVKIASMQLLFSLFSTVFIFTVTTLYTLILSHILFPSALEIFPFIMLNLYALALYLVIGGICFLGSVIANESKTSLSIGVGFPVTFLILKMIGDAGEQLSWVGNLSLFSLFKVDLITEDLGAVSLWIILFILLASVLYGASLYIFKNKDLYL